MSNFWGVLTISMGHKNFNLVIISLFTELLHYNFSRNIYKSNKQWHVHQKHPVIVKQIFWWPYNMLVGMYNNDG